MGASTLGRSLARSHRTESAREEVGYVPAAQAVVVHAPRGDTKVADHNGGGPRSHLAGSSPPEGPGPCKGMALVQARESTFGYLLDHCMGFLVPAAI